jgi:glycosyltransferase involved in cell wall biosynthesis
MSAVAPEVSVVIPTRNRAAYLRGALESALGQVGVELEVVVADDGSEDETPSLLAAIDDPRVRVIRFDPACGMAAARNEAIAAARGNWIAFLDDDDLWAPDKLRVQLETARRTGATWVYCGVYLVSPEGDVVAVPVPAEPKTILPQLLRSNVVQAGNSTVLVKADRLRALGAYAAGLHNPWDLWIRLAADGPAAAVEQPLAAYRRHPASFIAGNRRRALAEARLIAEKHRALSDAHGVEFDLAHYDRWLKAEAIRALRTSATAQLRTGKRSTALALQLRAFLRTRAWSDLRRLGRIVAGERVRAGFRRLSPAPEVDGTGGEPTPPWLARYLKTDPPGIPSTFAAEAPRS